LDLRNQVIKMSKLAVVGVCLAGLASLIVMGVVVISLRPSPKLTKEYQAEHNDTTIYMVSEFLGDYYCLHKKLPASFADIQPLFQHLQPGIRPSSAATATWKVLDQEVPDEENGGKISVVRISATDRNVVTSRDIPVDLRDPDRVWKFYSTYLPGNASECPLPTVRNLANGEAMAALRAHDAHPDRDITWSDISDDWRDGSWAIEAGARKKLTFHTTDKGIIVSVIGTSTVFRFPLSGPKVYNANF
jgi:hypothetical protein